MQISGGWYLCEDGIKRPIISGDILTATGSWVRVPFLIDTGADRTVFSAAVLEVLGLQTIEPDELLGGVGGVADSVDGKTQIRFTCEDARKVVFRGQYAAFTELEALDMSVLGRDITGMFGVIVDKPGNVVCLLGQEHRYLIQKQ